MRILALHLAHSGLRLRRGVGAGVDREQSQHVGRRAQVPAREWQHGDRVAQLEESAEHDRDVLAHRDGVGQPRQHALAVLADDGLEVAAIDETEQHLEAFWRRRVSLSR
jgi:hypothetical protein